MHYSHIPGARLAIAKSLALLFLHFMSAVIVFAVIAAAWVAS
jgi:hypothetical protein